MVKQRVVVKIGSSSLTNAQGGLANKKVAEHVSAVARLKQAGHEVILISSGAVAAGFTMMGYPSRPVTIAGKQASAAVGQGLLMHRYYEEFQKEGMVSAQLLLTRHDFAEQERYSNAYATLAELLKRGVIPIINENDSVAVDELTFGDNDMLSALVSGLVHADVLIILTDINGLYDGNPRKDKGAKKYHVLPVVTDELLAIAGDSGSKVGTGGMRSKLEAAKTAQSLGVNIFIGKGEGAEKLLDIIAGKGDGTYIGVGTKTFLKSKKQWIGLHSSVAGVLEIDAGAAQAVIHQGKSLLPAGVKKVKGTFVAGDVVEVWSESGELLGKGQVNYSYAELRELQDDPSQERCSKTTRPEVIHRDKWVTLAKGRK